MDSNKRKRADNGKRSKDNKKAKTELTKEGFLNSIKNLKLYTDEDKCYKEVSIEKKALQIEWG